MRTMAMMMILALTGCTAEVADEMPPDAVEDAGHVDQTADTGSDGDVVDAGYDWPDAEADAGDDAGVCVLYCVSRTGTEWCYAAGLSPDAYPAGVRCAAWE
jgi:hypothetical protein